KFFDIKCRRSGLVPSVAVVVATIRALKLHSGRYTVKVGKPLPPEMLEPNPEHVREGCANLRVHIENVRRFGVPVVVALNGYPSDSPEELAVVREVARDAGAAGTALCDVFLRGGEGGLELAELVATAVKRPPAVEFLYPLELPIAEKIERIATAIYRADGIEISELAAEKIATFEANGFGDLPICMAKTPLSLSHDEKRKGVPTGYVLPIRDVRASVGAGFIYPIVGSTVTMPGLPSQPAAFEIDIDDEGNTVGLF
ncbi:MAG: formate--tetrahydrofolate ligase, partial [Myxococcales bacterium]|nr:formate--tetrahydrofolate ligase [Myxococcales bacterium]